MGGPINNAQFNTRRSQVIGAFERAAGNLQGPPESIGSMPGSHPGGSSYQGLRYPGGTVEANWRNQGTGHQSSTITGAGGLQDGAPQVRLNNQGDMRYSDNLFNPGPRNGNDFLNDLNSRLNSMPASQGTRQNSSGRGRASSMGSASTAPSRASQHNGSPQGPGANPRNRSDKNPGASQNTPGKPPGGGNHLA